MKSEFRVASALVSFFYHPSLTRQSHNMEAFLNALKNKREETEWEQTKRRTVTNWVTKHLLDEMGVIAGRQKGLYSERQSLRFEKRQIKINILKWKLRKDKLKEVKSFRARKVEIRDREKVLRDELQSLRFRKKEIPSRLQRMRRELNYNEERIEHKLKL